MSNHRSNQPSDSSGSQSDSLLHVEDFVPADLALQLDRDPAHDRGQRGLGDLPGLVVSDAAIDAAEQVPVLLDVGVGVLAVEPPRRRALDDGVARAEDGRAVGPAQHLLDPIRITDATYAGKEIRFTRASVKPFKRNGEPMKGNPSKLGNFLRSAGLQAKPQTNSEWRAAVAAAKSKPIDEVKAADLGVSPVGWAGAGQQITSVTQAEARAAGEIVEDDGEGFTKIVAFLENLKVI